MRIEHLRIENFRRFQRVDVELGDGITALVGRNGAGKSTVLEAIGWCLYGNDAARTGKDLIKRRGAAPHEDVRVQLAFRFGAHVYEVTRELLGKSEQHSATVMVDGAIAVAAGAQSSKESTAFIERLFHLDRDAFFTTLVARQRELAALTSAKPAERKKLLIGLLRLDPVDAAIVEARALRRDARAELAGLRSAMVDEGLLRAQVDLAQKAVTVQKALLTEVEVTIGKLVEEVEDMRARRDSGRKFAEEHKRIAQEFAVVDARLAHLVAERGRRDVELAQARASGVEAAALAPQLQAIPAKRALVETLAARAIQHQELVRLRGELARADAEALAAHTEVEAARAALAVGPELRARIPVYAEERTTREGALTHAQRRVTELEAGARELAKQVNDLSGKERKVRTIGPEAPCPSCTRPLREHYEELLRGFATDGDALRASLAHSAPQLDAARKELAQALLGVSDLAARETALRSDLDRLAANESRAAAGSARLAEARARAARLREQEASLASAPFDAAELEAARVALRALETARDRHARLVTGSEREPELVTLLAELAASFDAATHERANLAARRQGLGFDPLAHDALERAADASEARLTEARLARERAIGERIRREDEEKRATHTLAQQHALAQRAVALEARVRLLEELAGERDGGLLPEFKDHLIGRIRPLLTLHAGRLFRELTEGRYADLEVDTDYDLLVHDEGKPYALARFSGGESDLANLCLRLAVSQVIAERAGTQDFGFLALDEIFGSQDETRKGNILRALAGLTTHFRQILLITHIPDVKESADHVLRVEARDDGTSHIVVDN